MSEIFFILTVIYLAYVVYGDNEDIEKSPRADIASSKLFKPRADIAAKVAINTSTAKPNSVKKELRTVVLKNPATGEEAKVANHYRMVKRWVKEALVEERLLEKIYKTNEMDDTAKVKVAEALAIIKAMDKYTV